MKRTIKPPALGQPPPEFEEMVSALQQPKRCLRKGGNDWIELDLPSFSSSWFKINRLAFYPEKSPDLSISIGFTLEGEILDQPLMLPMVCEFSTGTRIHAHLDNPWTRNIIESGVLPFLIVKTLYLITCAPTVEYHRVLGSNTTSAHRKGALVRAHLRRLPSGWKASPEALQYARRHGLYLPPDFTFVREHLRGNPSPSNQPLFKVDSSFF